MRGEYDGIASLADLMKFFEKLPNPGQAVRGDAGHCACLVPSEELRHLLPHPGELLLAAGADLQERALMSAPARAPCGRRRATRSGGWIARLRGR